MRTWFVIVSFAVFIRCYSDRPLTGESVPHIPIMAYVFVALAIFAALREDLEAFGWWKK